MTPPPKFKVKKYNTSRAPGRKLVRWSSMQHEDPPSPCACANHGVAGLNMKTLFGLHKVIKEHFKTFPWELVIEYMGIEVTAGAIDQHLCKARKRWEASGSTLPEAEPLAEATSIRNAAIKEKAVASISKTRARRGGNRPNYTFGSGDVVDSDDEDSDMDVSGRTSRKVGDADVYGRTSRTDDDDSDADVSGRTSRKIKQERYSDDDDEHSALSASQVKRARISAYDDDGDEGLEMTKRSKTSGSATTTTFNQSSEALLTKPVKDTKTETDTVGVAKPGIMVTFNVNPTKLRQLISGKVRFERPATPFAPLSFDAPFAIEPFMPHLPTLEQAMDNTALDLYRPAVAPYASMAAYETLPFDQRMNYQADTGSALFGPVGFLQPQLPMLVPQADDLQVASMMPLHQPMVGLGISQLTLEYHEHNDSLIDHSAGPFQDYGADALHAATWYHPMLETDLQPGYAYGPHSQDTIGLVDMVSPSSSCDFSSPDSFYDPVMDQYGALQPIDPETNQVFEDVIDYPITSATGDKAFLTTNDDDVAMTEEDEEFADDDEDENDEMLWAGKMMHIG